jgi:hypothetical protein
VDVAVAGVAEAERDQVVPAPDLRCALHRLVDTVDRDDDVLGDRAAAPRDDGGIPARRASARAPRCRRGSRGAYTPQRAVARRFEELGLNALGLGLRAVRLGHQEKARTVRDSSGKRRRTSHEGLLVEELERGRENAVPHDTKQGVAALAEPAVEDGHRENDVGGGQQLEPRGGDDPEGPSDPTSSRLRS